MLVEDNLQFDTRIEGTRRMAIMTPSEFLHMYPKCASIYHAGGGWLTRVGLDTLLDRRPELQGKRFGFIRREQSVPTFGGVFAADMYIVEEPELCAGYGSCACGAHLDNHTVLDECVDIMFEALEEVSHIDEESDSSEE